MTRRQLRYMNHGLSFEPRTGTAEAPDMWRRFGMYRRFRGRVPRESGRTLRSGQGPCQHRPRS